MTVGTIKPPRRTRSVIECDLMMAEGRLASLRKQMDCTAGDSDASAACQWYSTRCELLRRELSALTRP